MTMKLRLTSIYNRCASRGSFLHSYTELTYSRLSKSKNKSLSIKFPPKILYLDFSNKFPDLSTCIFLQALSACLPYFLHTLHKCNFSVESRGRRRCHPPTGHNYIIFARIFTEKRPHRRSAPPTGNPGSATDFIQSCIVPIQYHVSHFF